MYDRLVNEMQRIVIEKQPTNPSTYTVAGTVIETSTKCSAFKVMHVVSQWLAEQNQEGERITQSNDEHKVMIMNLTALVLPVLQNLSETDKGVESEAKHLQRTEEAAVMLTEMQIKEISKQSLQKGEQKFVNWQGGGTQKEKGQQNNPVCWNCRQKGHMKAKCPIPKDQRVRKRIWGERGTTEEKVSRGQEVCMWE